jgi:hypothetical protein
VASQFRKPAYWTAALAVAAVAFLAFKALLGDPHGFVERLVADLLGVFAGVAFGAAGLNQLGSWWLRRSRAAQISRPLFDYMRLAVQELAAIGASCYAVIEPTTTRPQQLPVGWAFGLPTSDHELEIFQDYDAAFEDAVKRLSDDPQAARDAAQRARELLPDIQEHRERCAGLIDRIVGYRPEEGQELDRIAAEMLTTVSDLSRDLEDPEGDDALSALQLRLLFNESHRVARILSGSFRDVWRLIGEREGSGAVIVEGPHARLP